MAVYTEVTDADLDAFLEQYDIGAAVSFKGIAEGVENSNYLLITDRAPFILTLYEKRVAAGDLPFFLGLMEHLSAKGLRCPVPVKGRDGEALRTLAGRPAAIITFLEGRWIKRPRPEHCQQLGVTLARFHEAGRDFPLRRTNALSLAGWAPLYATFRSRADEVEPALQALIDDTLAALAVAWPRELPCGVIHADLFPDNVFFLRDELSGIIDFYFACTDMLAYDLAICLNSWCFETDGQFNVTKARALLAGYQSIRPLSGAEIDTLPTLARGSALRFLLTRAHDWIFHDDSALVTPHDPKQYSRRLRFHRAVESASEYGLEV